MKWNLNTTLLLLAFLIISYLAWENWIIKKTNQTLQTQNLKKQVDTQEVEVEKKVIEWKTQKVVSEKIVDKWHNVHDTIIKLDTLLVECQKDIFSLDTAIKKCDTALNTCLSLNQAQKDLNKSLEKQNKNQKKLGVLKVIGSIGAGMLIENARKKID